MPIPVSKRVQKRREALKSAGLRPVQIWVPDTRRPGFDAECRLQSQRVAASDASDPDLANFLDLALADLNADEV